MRRATLVGRQTYVDFLTFVRLCNERVRGVAVSDTTYPVTPVSRPLPWPDQHSRVKCVCSGFPPSPLRQVIEALVAGLDAMYEWVTDIPPLQQPMRFGNRAFRSWHARLVERGPDLIRSLLPEVTHPSLSLDFGAQLNTT